MPNVSPLRAACAVSVAVMLLAGCGTKPAPDFRGKWREVNTLSSEPMPIPLQQMQAFVVSPVDRSLRDVLQRWSRQAALPLDYRATLDFTIHAAATEARGADLYAALAALQFAYAAQGVTLEVIDGRLVATVGPTLAGASSGSPPSDALN